MHLSYPFILLFIPLIFVIWYYFSKEKSWFKLPNSILQSYTKTPIWFNILYIFRFLIITIICIIIAWPSISHKSIEQEKEKQYMLFLLDISKSMLAEDVLPNRISLAKNTIKKFIQEQQDSTFWLIIFTWKPFLVINNSDDIEGIHAFLDTLSPDYILQWKPELSWTNIGDTLLLAKRTLEKNNTQQKSIILITDGSANVWIKPTTALDEIKKTSIPIYSIGIGKQNNEPIFYTNKQWQKIFFYNENNIKIISDLDVSLLQKIAIETHGLYFNWEDHDTLTTSFNKISETIKKPTTQKEKEYTTSIAPVFIFLLIIIWWTKNFLKQYLYRKYNII